MATPSIPSGFPRAANAQSAVTNGVSPHVDHYLRNPRTYRDRKLARSGSAWARSYLCEDMRVLIVCRGPIRKEAMDVFEQMGLASYGILLSEKDSIVYTLALAPELRAIHPSRVHRVKDYSGANKEEREERVAEIIAIAKQNGYHYIFAGYGFMAEDADFVHEIEKSGLIFMGPCSRVQRAAGKKDEAKRTALAQNVSVTPGVNDVSTRTLLGKAKDLPALRAIAHEHGLEGVSYEGDLSAVAESILYASYAAGIDLVSIDEIGAQVTREASRLLSDNPGRRVRIKAIGGGGGKGQRLLDGIRTDVPAGERVARAEEAASVAAEKLREVLAEVKATGVGDNKNVLLELNIEQTRHNEIQLVGNGHWCITMGGRDCSLQMHEQKLLEVSVTREGLMTAALRARNAGNTVEAGALESDLETLRKMEEEAERFGLAVGLDSASTFECIVDGDRHYFMEVNTRIQVEHRVSELCYALRFRNPAEPSDSFDVTSLVECMALIARHGQRLPKPDRVLREPAAVEARLNATDRSLAPHAGGSIVSWTSAIEGEIRDDQGISMKNPDTGLFMHYRLAGAYDSNIALLVTVGEDRHGSYFHLAEVLRRTQIRGVDLATNLQFHYGLVHWFLERNVYAKPTTRFVLPYLAAVGLLAEESANVDVHHAFAEVAKHHEAKLKANTSASPEALKAALAGTREAIARKETLLERPFQLIFAEPHFLSAWLSAEKDSFVVEGGRVVWTKNPIDVLVDTYHLLDMDFREDRPAAHVIWDHDHHLIETARGFYGKLEARLGKRPWLELDALLRDEKKKAPDGFDEPTWNNVRAAHAGFQCGLEVLGIFPLIGVRTGFYDLKVEEDLTVTIPERLHDPALQARMRRVLVPPPATKVGEIVAVSGGMYYAQEAPDKPPFVSVGMHFQKGQPLYVLEVMKMFNKVLAPFSGRVDQILVTGGEGTVVRKGQPLFAITPDEKHVEEDPKVVASRRREATKALLAGILG